MLAMFACPTAVLNELALHAEATLVMDANTNPVTLRDYVDASWPSCEFLSGRYQCVGGALQDRLSNDLSATLFAVHHKIQRQTRCTRQHSKCDWQRTTRTARWPAPALGAHHPPHWPLDYRDTLSARKSAPSTRRRSEPRRSQRFGKHGNQVRPSLLDGCDFELEGLNHLLRRALRI